MTYGTFLANNSTLCESFAFGVVSVLRVPLMVEAPSG
jgi:hypothetical protein